jgi:hypothetical protein
MIGGSPDSPHVQMADIGRPGSSDVARAIRDDGHE